MSPRAPARAAVTEVIGAPAAAAVSAWRRRALLVGGAFQLAFGAVWLLRGLRVLASSEVAIAAAAAALLAGAVWVYRLRSTGPRPGGSEARALELRITVATAAQLAASGILPVLAGLVAGRLVLPSVVVTIGILLAYLHRVAATPFQSAAGWLLIALSVAALGLPGGASQTASLCLASAVVLLSCAAAGFAWLERHR